MKVKEKLNDKRVGARSNFTCIQPLRRKIQPTTVDAHHSLFVKILSEVLTRVTFTKCCVKNRRAHNICRKKRRTTNVAIMRHPFFLYSTIAASLCTASPTIQQRQTSGDVVMSGLYSIQGCGTNASRIATILSSLSPFLQPAITDSEKTFTSGAYNTFFKDVHNAPFVRKILQNIAFGTPVLTGLAQPDFGRVTSPVIACIPDPPIVNPDPKLVGLTPWVQAFAKQDCHDRGDRVYGIFIGGTNIVALCPGWFIFNRPDEPKEKRPCIAVDRATNRFRGLGNPLAQNSRAWLLHELAHVYLVAATNKRVPYTEVYSINDCFRLNAGSQKYMPNNYVYYAGSVFYTCTNFPTVSFRDRELSTSSSNATDDVVWVNSSLTVTDLP